MSRKSLGVLAAAVLAVSGSGCAEEDSGASTARPVVYAASSLRSALPKLMPGATYNFAGSNQLRTQIEHGAPADVLIGASPKDPKALATAGGCAAPVAIATNELVLIVPADAPRVSSLAALARGGYRLALGAEGVPIGDYTRKLLSTAGASAVLTRNTVSSEPSVASISAKVREGSADAGFVYVTDAKAAGDAVRVVRLPAAAQPTVRYEACVVKRDGARTAAARAFLERLTSPRVQDALVGLGFGRAP